MYSPRLYKYQDSSVLYTPTVQLFSSLLQTHTLFVQTHKTTFPPLGIVLSGAAEIPEGFNTFFSSTGPKLAKNISNSTKKL